MPLRRGRVVPSSDQGENREFHHMKVKQTGNPALSAERPPSPEMVGWGVLIHSVLISGSALIDRLVKHSECQALPCCCPLDGQGICQSNARLHYRMDFKPGLRSHLSASLFGISSLGQIRLP